jgi:hypothetical protein
VGWWAGRMVGGWDALRAEHTGEWVDLILTGGGIG